MVAIPPQHRAGIAFEPALPDQFTELADHWPQGKLSKAFAAYPTPFWRSDGCSGEALSDDGPVFITFDVSPGDDGPGNDVVSFIFNIAQPFVAPFVGMFSLNHVTADQGSVLDVAAIVALIGWTLVEALVLAAIRIFSRRPSEAV